MGQRKGRLSPDSSSYPTLTDCKAVSSYLLRGCELGVHTADRLVIGQEDVAVFTAHHILVTRE